MDLCPFHVNRYIYLKRFDPLGNHIEQMRFGLGIIFYIHVMITVSLQSKGCVPCFMGKKTEPDLIRSRMHVSYMPGPDFPR